jgi:glycosyltransferase involved in cell wall biosynthesis
MPEYHESVRVRPESGRIGAAMRELVAHHGKKIRSERARTAGVSDYSAHREKPAIFTIIAGSCVPSALAGARAGSIDCRRPRHTGEAIGRVNAASTVRILALMEARSVTGPAKNLIGFCRWLSTPEGAQTGLSVDIATFDRDTRSSEGFVAAAHAAGISTHVMHERYRFDLGVLRQLRAVVAAARPDIIQTHNNKSHLLIKSLPEVRAGRLWFAFQHGYAYPDFKQRLYNQVDRLTLRSADRVVSVCQAFAPKLVAYGVRSERIRILHNAAVPMAAVSEPQRARLRDRLGLRPGESVVLSVGRLSKEKGHADLLRALGLLRRLPVEWKLVLVGIGPEQSALGRLARALGLAERVLFAGFHPEVAEFFAIADVFALPSHSEGSSNVLLEAMMAKVPVVATRAGGNPEILPGETAGLLVPVGDAPALAGAIERLLREPDLASHRANAAFARAADEFSLEHYQRRLAGFYAEALGSPNERAAYSVA